MMDDINLAFILVTLVLLALHEDRIRMLESRALEQQGRSPSPRERRLWILRPVIFVVTMLAGALFAYRAWSS
jgi:hypothetical protein